MQLVPTSKSRRPLFLLSLSMGGSKLGIAVTRRGIFIGLSFGEQQYLLILGRVR
jgi:hypothetical protein